MHYVSKKAGSLLFTRPTRQLLIAGQHIPDAMWDGVDSSVQQDLLATGMVEIHDDPDNVRLADPVPEVLPRVGVGKNDFMAEAKIQRGERVDAKLEALRAQAAAEAEAKHAEGESSQDGVVQVEHEDEDEEDYSELYDEAGDPVDEDEGWEG